MFDLKEIFTVGMILFAVFDIAVNLYLDIINLFIDLLIILAESE
tara:strand:- start:82 stop:213 length:132 start_codon:yes stop_codon:yes gene_type:complete